MIERDRRRWLYRRKGKRSRAEELSLSISPSPSSLSRSRTLSRSRSLLLSRSLSPRLSLLSYSLSPSLLSMCVCRPATSNLHALLLLSPGLLLSSLFLLVKTMVVFCDLIREETYTYTHTEREREREREVREEQRRLENKLNASRASHRSLFLLSR